MEKDQLNLDSTWNRHKRFFSLILWCKLKYLTLNQFWVTIWLMLIIIKIKTQLKRCHTDMHFPTLNHTLGQTSTNYYSNPAKAESRDQKPLKWNMVVKPPEHFHTLCTILIRIPMWQTNVIRPIDIISLDFWPSFHQTSHNEIPPHELISNEIFVISSSWIFLLAICS